MLSECIYVCLFKLKRILFSSCFPSLAYVKGSQINRSAHNSRQDCNLASFRQMCEETSTWAPPTFLPPHCPPAKQDSKRRKEKLGILDLAPHTRGAPEEGAKPQALSTQPLWGITEESWPGSPTSFWLCKGSLISAGYPFHFVSPFLILHSLDLFLIFCFFLIFPLFCFASFLLALVWKSSSGRRLTTSRNQCQMNGKTAESEWKKNTLRDYDHKFTSYLCAH